MKRRPKLRKGRRRRTGTALKIERDCKLNKRRYTKRYLRLMNHVKIRDQFKCQLPGCRKPSGVKLTIHHIYRHHDNIRLRQNKYNLISLCFESHKLVTGQEKKWAPRLKIIARRNESEYRKNKKTKEEILSELKSQQVLPDGFEEYRYKTDDEVLKVKKEEYWLTKYYRQIRFRTENKSSNSYKNYGGRGIKMCDEWRKSYEVFAKYIEKNLGERPEGASIDRIDNDKGYEPGNIRWATSELQGQNRRTTILNDESVAVILILYYKYKFKIAEILDKMNLPSRAAVSGVILGKTWTNISKVYLPIINNEKAAALIRSK
jgi:hypothetical protein